jgi:hypothetical protein
MGNVVISKGSFNLVSEDFHAYRWDYESMKPGEYLGTVRADNFLEACDRIAEQHGGTADQYFAAKRKIKE